LGVTRLRQAAHRLDETVDPSFRVLAPIDVERGEFRKELEVTVRQMVVDVPGEAAPIGAVRVSIREPWQDDTGRGPHPSLGISTVPGMAGPIILVPRAIEAVLIAELVDGGGAIGGADRHRAEGRAQRLQ
jgi:hypothetical protein